MLSNKIILEEDRDADFKFFNSLKLKNKKLLGFDMDKIYYNKADNVFFSIELLKCGSTQKVTPHTSHPNKYFYTLNDGKYGNRLKFLFQSVFCKLNNVKYICINYSEDEEKKDLIKIMSVKKVSALPEKRKNPFKTSDLLLFDNENLKEWVKNMNYNIKKV